MYCTTRDTGFEWVVSNNLSWNLCRDKNRPSPIHYRDISGLKRKMFENKVYVLKKITLIAHNVIERNLSLPLALHFPSAWQTLSKLIHVPCLVPSPLLPLTRQPKYFKFKTKYYWSLRWISSSIVVLTHPYYIWHTYLFINAGAACGCFELLR